MTDTQTPAELLPCPWDGQAADVERVEGGRFAAYCTHCGAMPPAHNNRADAVAAWNRRTPALAPREASASGAVALLQQLSEDAARWRYVLPHLSVVGSNPSILRLSVIVPDLPVYTNEDINALVDTALARRERQHGEAL